MLHHLDMTLNLSQFKFPEGTLEEDLERVRLLARWLDTRFSFLGFKFGADALLGLIPGIGDTITSLIALYPIHVARRHGLGWALQARMAANVGLDWLVGIVPLAGDLLDAAFKATTMNARLLEKAIEKKLAAKLPASDQATVMSSADRARSASKIISAA